MGEYLIHAISSFWPFNYNYNALHTEIIHQVVCLAFNLGLPDIKTDTNEQEPPTAPAIIFMLIKMN